MSKESGAEAKRHGDAFERAFSHSCRNMALSRMPDGCRVVGKNRLIRVKTSFDWILTKDGRSAFIDTKTTALDHLPASALTEHQVEALALHEHYGAIAGYVIELRPKKSVYFVPAFLLLACFRGRRRITQGDMAHRYLGSSDNFNPGLIFL